MHPPVSQSIDTRLGPSMGSSSSSLPTNESTSSNTNLVEAGETRVIRHPLCRVIWFIRTLIGVVTTILLFVAAADAFSTHVKHLPLAIYLILIGCPVFLLEIGFIVKIIFGTDGICCRMFSLILSFDKIKRGLLYITFSLLCLVNFLGPTQLSIASGIMLIVTGVMYILKDREYKMVKTYINNESSAVQVVRETETA